MVQLSKYESFLINGWLDILSQNKVALLKDVLDFEFQPHPGAGHWCLDSGVMM